MALKKYREKRDFKATQEPFGEKISVSKNQGIFVVQLHKASHLHYDFRLEMKGVLKSWAIPKGPSLDPTIKRLAVHVEDHPLEYAKFEGIIPKGQYGAGSVKIWDQGNFLTEEGFAGYKAGSLTLVLNGKKLKGMWKLVQIKKDPKNWLLIKISDKYAKP